ncbi:MAG: hypothetical protein LBD02_08210 [Christensenellaceae bacterium]|nr:hypothetical protein [Christensenellaceae bacterium]
MEENFYYLAGKCAPSPLSDAFDYAYFTKLLQGSERLSAKAFLATEQRIPGLGNGILQDILLAAGVHPKRKMLDLSQAERMKLFDCLKALLRKMTQAGGRDTEKDLFGRPGGYKTKLSRNNTLLICPNCGSPVQKQAYLGGSVYFCESCQPL